MTNYRLANVVIKVIDDCKPDWAMIRAGGTNGYGGNSALANGDCTYCWGILCRTIEHCFDPLIDVTYSTKGDHWEATVAGGDRSKYLHRHPVSSFEPADPEFHIKFWAWADHIYQRIRVS